MPSDVERKLALLDLLASRRALTVEQVFGSLPSFYSAEGRDPSSAKKMFERDKEDLAAMGFPLLAETDRVGREAYRLDPPDPALPPDFVLTPGEARSLRDILENPVLRSQLPGPALQALLKLYELYSPPAREGPLMREDAPPKAALIAKILSAIGRGWSVDVDYPGHDGRPERRVFSPWRLVLKLGEPYLLAWCHRDGIPKMLSLDRMGRLASSRVPYRGEPEGFRAGRYLLTHDYLPDEGPGWRVRLRVDAEEAWRLEETVQSLSMAGLPDGGRMALFGVSNPERFFRYVLSFGRHAEILSPPEARTAFRRFLEEAAP